MATMVLTAAYFVATTGLYLVASEIGGRALRVSRSSFSRLLSMAAVLLMAYGLWWPAQASQGSPSFGASFGVHALLAWSACFALPSFGWLAANRIARRAYIQGLQAVVATLLAAYVLAMASRCCSSTSTASSRSTTPSATAAATGAQQVGKRLRWR
jgi:hypothetical protein